MVRDLAMYGLYGDAWPERLDALRNQLSGMRSNASEDVVDLATPPYLPAQT